MQDTGSRRDGGAAKEWDMTDENLHKWWPDFADLIAELRRGGKTEEADRLVEAVRGGATSSEILGSLGIVLRCRRGLRSRLGPAGKRAWDAVMADIDRPYPLRRLTSWCARLASPGDAAKAA